MRDYSNLDQKIPGLRVEYKLNRLDEKGLAPDPLEQFAKWFGQALKAGSPKPNAMTLSTASSEGEPSARTVLLKGFDRKGFVFYSQYESRKGRDIAQNPRGCLVFYWPELERQVTVMGKVTKTSTQESAGYFSSRPRDTQLAAWISKQSAPIKDRPALEQKFIQLKNHFRNRPIPIPKQWGGYRLMPESIEFWQGRENRLNDRLRYVRAKGKWRVVRLQP